MTYIPRPDPNPIWLNGLTCLDCGQGWYDGYVGYRTAPCQKCGKSQASHITQWEFDRLTKLRDGLIDDWRSRFYG